uniref:Cathepsin propeptide inhibitor domain-containing protein n=1 Tax=Heliothis virescens TaxID=7102 RepID=A0A2A4IZI2_HELVI
MVVLIAFIKITLLIKLVKSEDSDTELFEKFKNNYHRVYYNLDSEQKGYLNFVNNLNQVKKLNREHPGSVVAYQLNRYADLDPVEVKDHYGIVMLPYDHVEDVKEAAARLQKPHKFLEDMHLYDLNEVEDLYEDYVKKFCKANYTKKLDQTIHYYRFIKTVVETNKKIFAGEKAELNADADVIREPDEYFYG